MFSQLLRSLFVSSLFSDFQHSFLSSPLSANDLASYLTEKRDAIRLERPHPSTINSPAFPYQYTKLCLHFCSKGKKTDEILCPVIRSPLILKTSLLPSPVLALSFLWAFKHGSGALARLPSLQNRRGLKDTPAKLTFRRFQLLAIWAAP